MDGAARDPGSTCSPRPATWRHLASSVLQRCRAAVPPPRSQLAGGQERTPPRDDVPTGPPHARSTHSFCTSSRFEDAARRQAGVTRPTICRSV